MGPSVIIAERGSPLSYRGFHHGKRGFHRRRLIRALVTWDEERVASQISFRVSRLYGTPYRRVSRETTERERERRKWPRWYLALATRCHLLAFGAGDTRALSFNSSLINRPVSCFSPTGSRSSHLTARFSDVLFRRLILSQPRGHTCDIACLMKIDVVGRVARRYVTFPSVFHWIIIRRSRAPVTAREYSRWTFLVPIVNSLLFVQVGLPEKPGLCRFGEYFSCIDVEREKDTSRLVPLKSCANFQLDSLIKAEESPRVFAIRSCINSSLVWSV